MHYHNDTYFGHIRPSSGNTFIRSLMHCALIKYHSFSYVVFFISFLEMRLFLYFLVCYFLVYREYSERKVTLDADIKKITHQQNTERAAFQGKIRRKRRN
jgi:Ca2+/Na+ antiporter